MVSGRTPPRGGGVGGSDLRYLSDFGAFLKYLSGLGGFLRYLREKGKLKGINAKGTRKGENQRENRHSTEN